jgi:WD40 repeat protein
VSGGNYHDRKKGGNVRVWDLRNRTVFTSLDDLPEQMNTVGFSPNGDVLWAGGGSKSGQVASWPAGAPKIQLVPAGSLPHGAVQALAVGENQVYLTSWRLIWSLGNDSVDGTGPVLFKGDFSYSSLALSPDGQRLAAGTWKNNDQWHEPASVQLFDTGNPTSPTSDLPVRGTRVNHLVFSADGRRLLAATNASDVQVWDTVEYRPIVNFYADGWMIDGFGLSPDSRQTVTIDTSGVVRLWDLPQP